MGAPILAAALIVVSEAVTVGVPQPLSLPADTGWGRCCRGQQDAGAVPFGAVRLDRRKTDRPVVVHEFTAGENGGIACLLQTSFDGIKSWGVDSQAYQSTNRYQRDRPNGQRVAAYIAAHSPHEGARVHHFAPNSPNIRANLPDRGPTILPVHRNGRAGLQSAWLVLR